MHLLRSFDFQLVRDLAALHRRIEAPVKLMWGELDRFFPVQWAHEMVSSFPDASISVIAGAGLFAHEKRPLETAQAMLPTLTA